MSISKLLRSSGAAAVLCGVLTIAFWFIHPSAADPRAPHDDAFFAALQGARFRAVFLVFVALLLLSLLSLVGFYARLRQAGGRLGLLGFVLSLVGTAMFVASGVFQSAVAPVLAGSGATRQLLAEDGPLLGGLLRALFAATGLTFAAGYVLFGLSMLRSGALPRGAAVLLMLGAPVLGLSPLMPLPVRMLGCLCWGAGNVWLGSTQLTLESTPAPARR